jgi:hypothetical protein
MVALWLCDNYSRRIDRARWRTTLPPSVIWTTSYSASAYERSAVASTARKSFEMLR